MKMVDDPGDQEGCSSTGHLRRGLSDPRFGMDKISCPT
jgi:hypothetical protein